MVKNHSNIYGIILVLRTKKNYNGNKTFRIKLEKLLYTAAVLYGIKCISGFVIFLKINVPFYCVCVTSVILFKMHMNKSNSSYCIVCIGKMKLFVHENSILISIFRRNKA